MNFHLDLETFSEVDIKKVGLDVYARHPSTEIIMGAWSVDQQPMNQTDNEGKLLNAIREALGHPDTLFHAFNAPFERLILRHVAGIDIPIERWRCTLVHAYSLGFSGGLDDIGKQLGLPADRQKLATGKKLIQKFCKPHARGVRHTRQSHLDEWLQFCDYNAQDVVAEREIGMLLARYPMSQEAWDLWFLDQRINDRGLPIDRELVVTALRLFQAEQAELKQRMKDRTGLNNPNSGPQLLGWLEVQGFPLPNLQVETVTEALQRPPWDAPEPHVADVLRLRQQLARTAGSKWQAFRDRTDWLSGNRLRHTFQYRGASRTGRWAGRGVQPHNLHRSPKDQDAQVEFMLDKTVNQEGQANNIQWLRLYHGNVMDTVASIIRAGIKAPEGKSLVVCDLSSIESRILAWMSDCQDLLNTFETGGDPYIEFASRYYHVPYSQVTKDQRTFAKPPVLGCGYQLGVDGLIRYAESMGSTMTREESMRAVNTFRTSYPEIPEMWETLHAACKRCTETGEEFTGYTIHISRDDQFLMIRLPSGRVLHYYQPQVKPRTIKITDAATGEKKDWKVVSLTYMGLDQDTHQWKRIATHGGKITENIDQAIGADILAEGMRRADPDPVMELVGHVHDELITLVNTSVASEALLRLIRHMCPLDLSWATGLPLEAAGYIAERYRKE